VSLDELAEFLTSARAPDGCMDLSELDGFLAGLAAGPVEIPQEEWLAEVWDNDAPEFASAAEREEVLTAILDHYVAVEAALDASPLSYTPILWQDVAGTTVSEDWAAGFMQAVSMRSDEWKAALADEDTSLLLIPIASLAQNVVAPTERGAALPDEALDRLAEDAEQVLPVCVAGLRRFWRDRRIDAAATRH
jgi:uncharacterized protein